MKTGWIGGESSSASSTISLGKQLAKYLEEGDIINLRGNLGAGKTTFVKGVAEGLGFKGVVNSPTFTLINEYHSNPKLVHIDCYREKNIDRWNIIGISDYFSDKNIIIIEWPDILEQILPKKGVFNIRLIHISESNRKIFLED